MGWLYGYDWRHRDDLVRHLTGQDTDATRSTSTNGKLVTLKKCFRGNNLWAVQQWQWPEGQKPETEDGRDLGQPFIILYMMQYDNRREYQCWGYKDVSASMGPTYYNCPVSWFDEVPVDGEYDREWREECRRLHAGTNRKLVNGSIVETRSPITWTDGVAENKYIVSKYNRKTRFKRACDHVVVRFKKTWLTTATIDGKAPEALAPA
ncbi:MAG: hypothetical protein JSS66_05820 [Armatimonadetes bacterium]|nr:hypothetical protein [Armatimonadota bacterium]